MVSLGALMLGLGERSMLLPVGVLLAALISIWITDVTGWFHLNRPVTRIAALAAVLLSLWQVLELRSSVQVLAIANLLVYLQVVLLFQDKDYLTYWQLMMLSLLQVVSAAAFNQGALFGVILAAYLVAGLAAMTLLFFYRERNLFGQAAEAPAEAPTPPGRWPLASWQSSFAGTPAGASDRSAVGGELWRRLGRVAGGTVLLTAVIFFALPRLGNSAWRGPGAALRKSVGFSDQVMLGELGSIIENRQEVLRIRFFEDQTRQPYAVQNEVYLRGAVLMRYSHGRWRALERPVAQADRPVERGVPLPGEAFVRQEITIEPMDRNELFCVWPFVGADEQPDSRFYFDARRQRLLRQEEYARERFTFELATTAFTQGVQSVLIPSEGAVNPRPLLAMPADQGRIAVPGLAAQARAWLGDVPLSSGDRLSRARLLERMLRDSGRFQYSLEGQVRDRALDPIEDFVTKHPRGHCEYFASALVLMLRSQGIPARLVVGYKTDEWNDLGGFFQVRQLHAHTWVEAYLEPQQLPADLIRGDRHWEWADGGWLRLDPTPGGEPQQAARETLLKKTDRYLSWLDYLWDSYVVEMDSPRQREAIYRPLINAVESAAKRLTDPAWWRSMLGNLWRTARGGVAHLGVGWRLVGISVVVALAALMLSWAYRVGLTPRRFLKRLTGQAAAASGRPHATVEFYRRLEAALARHGLVRASCQTQREFAEQAGLALAQSVGRVDLAALPPRIAEAFYEVRFGGQSLEPAEHGVVEAALRELEQADQPAVKKPM
jgi:transglutaminase-like putative cysteine protease